MSEHATLSDGLPPGTPEWVRRSIQSKREQEHLPESLQQKFKRMDKLQHETPCLDRALKKMASLCRRGNVLDGITG